MRQHALTALIKIEQGEFIDSAAAEAFANAAAIDKPLLSHIIYGTVTYRRRLDYIIAESSSVKLSKIARPIMNILRLSLYQLIFLDRVPHNAVVDEAVKLAKKYGHTGSAGYVNAMLRGFLRKGEPKYPSAAILHSFPDWLAEYWCESYGESAAEQLMQASNRIPTATVRVNRTRTTPTELIASLSQSGITAEQSDEYLLTIKNHGDIASLPQHKAGLFTVQDAASYSVCGYADIPANGVIIDTCSSPGGKATHFAERFPNATIIACDKSAKKVAEVADNAKRLHLPNIQTKVADARNVAADLRGAADLVLCDVPCSGLGVISKKPDIKWQKDIGAIKELAKTGASILSAAEQYLKPGGSLIYSTCTLSPIENEGVTHSYTGSLRIVSEKQLFPHIDNCDGFYICVLRKE